MNTCKHCRRTVTGSSHYCTATGETYDRNDDGSDFLMSAVIGYATDSAILGGIIGGDMSGGIVGDLLDGDLFD